MPPTSLALVPFGRKSTVTSGVDLPADTADGSTKTPDLRTTDDSNMTVGLPGRLLSSMWQLIRSPAGAVQWGRTLDNKISRGAAAIHETIGDWAHHAGRGPHAVAENIKSSFGEGSDRVRNLAAVQRELKIQKEEGQKPEEEEEEEEPMEISKRIDPSKLRKQCAQFMRYTLRKQRADMQCEAFQRLVDLTTLFPGLRLMLLLSGPIPPHKPVNLKDMISMWWDRPDSSFCPDDESEWRYWRSFAETCLSEAPISLTIERCPITQFAQCQGTSSCVIEELLRVHRSCDDAKELLGALCIRYLGQTVTLVEFWDQVKAADPACEDSPRIRPHIIVQNLCLIMRKTLQDLQPQDTRPFTFDYEGFDFLASKILEQIIKLLQVGGAEDGSVGRWRSTFIMVVRLLRQEWCKAYLPHSSRLAHCAVFKDRTPPKSGTGVDSSSTTKMQGLDENQRSNDVDGTMAAPRNTEHAEETDLAAPDLANPSNVMIGIIGPTGTGKSSFIRLLTGDISIEIGHGVEATTSAIRRYNYFDEDGRWVTFIDTPGFDDSREEMTDTDIIRKFAAFLKLEFGPDKKLGGIIYFHRITDNRMGGVSRRNLNTLRKVCGDDILKSVVVVTTRWDHVQEKDRGAMGKREKEMMETPYKFFEPLIAAGGRFLRHDNSTGSARSIMDVLLKNHPIPLQSQLEMQFATEMEKVMNKHHSEMESLKQEMAEANGTKDEALKKELMAKRIKMQEEMAKWEEQKKALADGAQRKRKAELDKKALADALATEREDAKKRQQEEKLRELGAEFERRTKAAEERAKEALRSLKRS